MNFPKGFFFGASTSSHQVEGGNKNNWTEWERVNARRLSLIANHRSWPENILKNFPGPLQEENYISGKACDHYNRYEEDFDLAKELGHNAHRFSIEWSRIEPEEGRFNVAEIEHYKKVVRALRERGIEPFATLWHWTLPLWLSKQHGILNKKFPEYLERYTKMIVEALGNDVGFWITLNEPEIVSLNSYFRGLWPPACRSFTEFFSARTSLIRANKRMTNVIKQHNSEHRVGISCNLSHFESGGGPLNNILTYFANRFWNFYVLDRVVSSLDFVGLNFYFHNRINYGLNRNKNEKVSDMGWELMPQSIGPVLKALHTRYSKPIYITEHGLADAEDKNRAWFIEETFKAMERALSTGVDLRGYFHWSLLDNFEWDKGFWPRFGLIEIDYETMKRKIRKSSFDEWTK